MKVASDSEAKKRWDKENTVMIAIKFQKKTDQDVIDFLLSESGKGRAKRDVINEALREYMKNHEEA